MDEQKRAPLGRGAILNASDEKFENVETPEWGEGAYVRVRGLTSEDRDAWETSLQQEKADPKNPRRKIYVTDTRNLRAKLVVRCVVDANGQPVFTDGDVVHLGKRSAAVVDRIFAVAQRLSGIGEDDLEKLEGNSPDAPPTTSSAT